MNKLLSAFPAIVLAAAFPASAVAQTGACVAESEGFVVCVDGVTGEQCGDFPVATTFFDGETCADRPDEWEGACTGPSVEVPGNCALIRPVEDGDSQEFCEGGVNTWVPGVESCEGVPTLPLAALLTLGLVFLASGALLLRRQRGVAF